MGDRSTWSHGLQKSSKEKGKGKKVNVATRSRWFQNKTGQKLVKNWSKSHISA
jgi:hypothetical protein